MAAVYHWTGGGHGLDRAEEEPALALHFGRNTPSKGVCHLFIFIIPYKSPFGSGWQSSRLYQCRTGELFVRRS